MNLHNLFDAEIEALVKFVKGKLLPATFCVHEIANPSSFDELISKGASDDTIFRNTQTETSGTAFLLQHEVTIKKFGKIKSKTVIDMVSSGHLLSDNTEVELSKRRWIAYFAKDFHEPNLKFLCYLKVKESSEDIDFATLEIDPRFPTHFKYHTDYGIDIVDKNGAYSFDNSKVFYTVFPEDEKHAGKCKLTSVGFEGHRAAMIDHGIHIVSSRPEERALIFQMSFQSGKPVFNYKGQAIGMVMEIKQDFESPNLRYFGLNLCNSGKEAFEMIKNKFTVYSAPEPGSPTTHCASQNTVNKRSPCMNLPIDSFSPPFVHRNPMAVVTNPMNPTSKAFKHSEIFHEEVQTHSHELEDVLEDIIAEEQIEIVYEINSVNRKNESADNSVSPIVIPKLNENVEPPTQDHREWLDNLTNQVQKRNKAGIFFLEDELIRGSKKMKKPVIDYCTARNGIHYSNENYGRNNRIAALQQGIAEGIIDVRKKPMVGNFNKSGKMVTEYSIRPQETTKYKKFT